MAERIIHSKSVYDVGTWEKDFKKSRKLQKMMEKHTDPEKLR